MATSAPPRLFPLSETARILCVPARWLRAEAEAGRIPHLRADTALLFDLETVEKVLLERARTGGAVHAS
jgi:hypothetical protein